MDNNTKLLIGLVIFTIVFVSSISFAFGDQVHPHKRCEIYEKMTWNEELNKHECFATSFTEQETPTCSKDVDYVWKQTGNQSYEQVICNKPITEIEQTDFEYDAHVWDYWAWNFVFTNFHGF